MIILVIQAFWHNKPESKVMKLWGRIWEKYNLS